MTLTFNQTAFPWKYLAFTTNIWIKVKTTDTLVNSTCILEGIVEDASFFAGNAAFAKYDFATGEKSLTGFDFSGKVDIVQSWLVTFDQEVQFNEALNQHISDLEGKRFTS